MSHDQQHLSRDHAASASRHASHHRHIELPQLRLPTFALRASAPKPAERPTERPTQHYVRSTYAPPVHAHHAPGPAGPALVPAQPQMIPQHAPAIAYHHAQATPQAVGAYPTQAYQQRQVHARPTLAGAGAPAPFRSTFDEPAGARVTPLHMGVLLTLLVLAFVIARGTPSGSFRATPARLPAAVTPSGAHDLPLKREPAGMPSSASAQSLALEQGGKARYHRGDTTAIRLKSMPSPAAAATLAPTLPLHRLVGDGNSLPRSIAERDSHAVDHHYAGASGSQTLPLERAVATPAVTPGQAAAQAEVQANTPLISDDDYVPATALPNQAS